MDTFSYFSSVGLLYEGTAKLKTKADIRKAEKGENSVNKGFKADFDRGKTQNIKRSFCT